MAISNRWETDSCSFDHKLCSHPNTHTHTHSSGFWKIKVQTSKHALNCTELFHLAISQERLILNTWYGVLLVSSLSLFLLEKRLYRGGGTTANSSHLMYTTWVWSLFQEWKGTCTANQCVWYMSITFTSVLQKHLHTLQMYSASLLPGGI
jgi:hypothetical protein